MNNIDIKRYEQCPNCGNKNGMLSVLYEDNTNYYYCPNGETEDNSDLEGCFAEDPMRNFFIDPGQYPIIKSVTYYCNGESEEEEEGCGFEEDLDIDSQYQLDELIGKNPQITIMEKASEKMKNFLLKHKEDIDKFVQLWQEMENNK